MPPKRKPNPRAKRGDFDFDEDEMYRRVYAQAIRDIERLDVDTIKTMRELKKSSTSVGRLRRWLKGLRSPRKLLIAVVVLSFAIAAFSEQGRKDIQAIANDATTLLYMLFVKVPLGVIGMIRSSLTSLRWLNEQKDSKVKGSVKSIFDMFHNTEGVKDGLLKPVTDMWKKEGINFGSYLKMKNYVKTPRKDMYAANRLKVPEGVGKFETLDEFYKAWGQPMANYLFSHGQSIMGTTDDKTREDLLAQAKKFVGTFEQIETHLKAKKL